MTKQEILDKFSDINFVYNDSSKHETLSRMLNELLKEQDAKIEQLKRSVKGFNPIARCKDCKHYHKGFNCDLLQKPILKDNNWFCADGERRI